MSYVDWLLLLALAEIMSSVHKRDAPIATAAFDAFNRASKSHMKTNQQNCGRRKVLHETFITSGTGCGYRSGQVVYANTRMSDMCNRIGERCTGGCHRSRANIDFNLGSLRSEVLAMKSNVPVLRDHSGIGVVALVYAQRHIAVS